MTDNYFTNDGFSKARTLAVEASVILDGGVFVGLDEGGVRSGGVHLTGTKAHALIEALKPYAVAPVEVDWRDPAPTSGEAIAEWERELLESVEPKPKPKRFEVGQRVRLTGPHYIADGVESATHNEAPHGEGSLATITYACDTWGEGKAYGVRWDGALGRSSVVATGSLSAFEPESPGRVVGSIVYVTGDSDVWDHGFESGVAVEIVTDDVALDGSYEVKSVKTGDTAYVGANDLTIDPPHVQEIPNGAEVKIVDDGREHGLRHFLSVGSYAKVVGWTDVSASADEECSEIYSLQGESDGTRGTIVQSVSAESLKEVSAFRRYVDALDGVAVRYALGVDPAVATWERAIEDRPFVSFEKPKTRRVCICGSTTCMLIDTYGVDREV